LTTDTDLVEHSLEIYDDNYKMAGTLQITTQFIWADVDPIPSRLNSKCKLILTIVSGTWLADADLFGKQDPYVQWTFGKSIVKTTVKDEAGKEATWDEKFTLNNIKGQILNGEELVLNSYDEDLLIHDFLGGSRPIPWQDFCFDETEKTMTVDLYDKKKKKAGTLTFKTKFVYVELKMKAPLQKLNPNSTNLLWKGMSASINLENALTKGMKANI